MADSVALLFPGQGSQSVGMGRAWGDARPDLMAMFDEAGEIVGYDLRALCADGPAAQLNDTAYTQPALLVTSLVAWRALGDAVKPAAVAGHSLGEYTAIVAAGGLSFADAVALVRTRARYMAEAVPPGSGMVAAILGLAGDVVEEVCRAAQLEESPSPSKSSSKSEGAGVVTAVNFNAPGQVVIAGERAAVERAIALAKDRGCRRAIPLPVSVPVHSSLMRPAADRFAPHVHAAPFVDVAVPLVTNVDARAVTRAEDIRDSLIRQLPSPVLWERSVRVMWDMGIRTFVEVGPGTVLTGLVKRIVPEATALNVHDPTSLDKTLTSVGHCG